MTIPSWKRHYLDALLRSRPKRAAQYETTAFLATVLDEPADGIVELLLHRTIAHLPSIDDAVRLLELIQATSWSQYGPRILARIGDTEAVLQRSPHLAEYFGVLRGRTAYTTYSIKDWRLISDGKNYRQPDAPVWASRITGITEILEDGDTVKIGINQVVQVLQHLFAKNIRVFQVALLTNSSSDHEWAEILHRVLTAPLLEIGGAPHLPNLMADATPSNVWAPHWQIIADPKHNPRWHIREIHTHQELIGLGTASIYDQISVLLALSGLLREGILLSPIDHLLVQPLTPSQPIWGFRRREFSAARTTYQAEDVRALALAFLQNLSPSKRVSIFRSRLAMRLVSDSWTYRASTSVLSGQDSFYQQVVQTARLVGRTQFLDAVTYIEDSPYRDEPVFRYFYAESQAALALFDRFHALDRQATPAFSGTDDETILCITHASVPEQTGGYAIRAHGILTSLRTAGIPITAVTRPGFPAGALTRHTTEVVDGVEYARLPATKVTRNHGEIQYLSSFIEPFKALFQERGVSRIHIRSTFLIALPALIAARELGLSVLYEVSGLWELVYQDREQPSHLLKRSTFAEQAETLVMTNVDQLVVMNEAVRRIAIERGVDPDKIHLAPNAVNTESFQPLEPPRNDVFTVGYLGSFQDYEGLHDLVDAAKLLYAQDIPVRFLLVGDGLQLNPVKSYIHAKGLDEIFELTGRIPHDEVIGQYQRMDLLVYPRRSTGATETITPLKPFEALALAKPIIVSDVHPLVEIAGDNERALIFENGNVHALADAVIQLQRNPEQRSQLGAVGREWVVKHRNWDAVVRTFTRAYDRMKKTEN